MQYFASVDDSLFHAIVNRCVVEGTVCMDALHAGHGKSDAHAGHGETDAAAAMPAGHDMHAMPAEPAPAAPATEATDEHAGHAEHATHAQ